jgi:hypothetical protein
VHPKVWHILLGNTEDKLLTGWTAVGFRGDIKAGPRYKKPKPRQYLLTKPEPHP